MESVVRTLENLGLRVGNSKDGQGRPTYLITDPDEGITYTVPRADLEELQEKGKLSLAAFKEHDEKIRREGKR